MTLEELCKKYKKSENTVLNALPRTQASILKKYGVKIIKIGRGKDAEYIESVDQSNRALTLYEEPENNLFYIDDEIISLEMWEFMIFIALLVRPELVYRGTYKQLLGYLKKPINEKNLGAISAAIDNLKNRGYVLFAEDDEDDYFILGLKRHVEKQVIDIQMDLVKTCYKIAEENNKQSWVPLLKVYAGAMYLHPEEPYTMEQLSALIGLPISAIRDSKKLLEENNIVKFKKEYIEDSYICLGSSADINAIYSRRKS